MNDNNLRQFIEAVNSEVDSKIELIEKEADEKCSELLENAENEALNEAYKKIRSCVSEEKQLNKMTVSKAEQEARIKVLTYRENLVGRIFDSVDDKLINFTHSEGYSAYLESLLDGEEITKDTVIFLREEDMKYEPVLRRKAGNECSFEPDPEIVYGGLSVYDRNSSVLINKTLDSMLDEQKKDFGSNYRLA
ncbi:V-type ATP synthase subunit E [Ruminococcus sp. HUN007]|jgi:vacuolar-type H+-ATPase subunit E/Vma4|uniref:V-type ATP synthase subunit E n=1 Tax=Ruminococcus sp. HUN007 TaxID=1514668 RepID=UPI0005D29CCA|nr:V-type ATP synthase subunit E [Ruminococcus sp. HUN007]